MISYAQNQEDVFLNRVFVQDETGFYIDIGACHPTIDSVTKHFYDKGWNGINIEPIPKMFEKLSAARPRDINLNIAISNEEGESDFFTCPDALVLSTLTPQIAQDINEAGVKTETIRIETQTLKHICTTHSPKDKTLQFMKIDVEAHEQGVLESCDFSQCRPQVVLVEATKPRTRISNHEQWEHLLLEAEYLFAAFDGLNRYYVRQENKEFVEPLAQPLSCFDKYLRYAQIVQINWMRHQLQDALSQGQREQVQNVLRFISEFEKRPEWMPESPAFLEQRLKEFLKNA